MHQINNFSICNYPFYVNDINPKDMIKNFLTNKEYKYKIIY